MNLIKKKLSQLDLWSDAVPDDTLIYIVVGGVSYRTTKATLVAGLGGGGGAETFLELIDTPSTYTGQAGKYPKVNESETGLEFDDAPAPDLQAVLEQGASFSLSQGTATTTGQLGNYNALQNSFRDGSVITSVDGNVTRTTIRSGSKAGCIIVNEVYDDSTEITKQGQMGILESNVIIESNYQDLNNPDDSQTASANITDGEIVISQSKKGGNNNASLRLNPGDGLFPEYTTADDEDGEQTIATREWVQANVSGGAVDSVNNKTGDVVLDAEDVGAEPALGFTPENVANKTTDINGVAGTYPDTPTVKEYVDLDENLWNAKAQYLGVFRITTISSASTISTTSANTNNTVVLLPLRVGKPATIDRIAIMNNAENDGASSTVTFYVYDDSNGGLPGNKLFQVISSAGALIGTQKVIELTVNFALPRGNYYIGYHFRGLNTAGTNPTFVGGNITLNSVLLGSLSYLNNSNAVLRVTSQSADLGNNPTVTNLNSTSINLPQIFIRLA
jgi:hypothetical protein